MILSPEFLIASTGRSGSGYISKVLREYGINCGHEEYFGFPWNKKKQLEGDSSWLSVNHLNKYQGIVLHQTRNPLLVLSSLLHSYPDNVNKKFLRYRYDMIPYQTGSLISDFMIMIIDMNKKIQEKASYRYKIEEFDVDIMENILDLIGKPFNQIEAQEAIEKVPNNYNKHNSGEIFSVDNIPECDEKHQFIAHMKIYGY